MEDKSLVQVYQQGIDILFRELGSQDAVRFLQLFYSVHGDYTRDRYAWLNQDSDEFIQDFKRWKQILKI